MTFLVTSTHGLSSPSYFDIVELQTKRIRVLILLKEEVFIFELLETILLDVLTWAPIGAE
jgi:hypothetical protein